MNALPAVHYEPDPSDELAPGYLVLPDAPIEPDLYQQLLDLPENLVGEIIHGQLYTQSRPTLLHGSSSMAICDDLYGPFHRGRGGSGGWWIIAEPELHFVRDREVLVPDIAGWRKTRMPLLPEGHRCEIVPDWVCEILSPSTTKKDRALKMAIYAQYGVQFCWLVDPLQKTLESYALEAGHWRLLGVFADAAQVTAPPFEAITIDLAEWWT